MCGLVDLQRYADHEPAIALLEKVTDFASRTLDRSNNLANPSHNTAYYGVPQEWSPWRRISSAPPLDRQSEVQDVWRSVALSRLVEQVAQHTAPPDAHGVHAYSHVNTFSSAAMAYEVLGETSYLRIVRNGYDYLQQTQVYATGG